MFRTWRLRLSLQLYERDGLVSRFRRAVASSRSTAAPSLRHDAKRAYGRSGFVQNRHSPFSTGPETSSALLEQFAYGHYGLGARSREVREHDPLVIREIGTVAHVKEIARQGRAPYLRAGALPGLSVIDARGDHSRRWHGEYFEVSLYATVHYWAARKLGKNQKNRLWTRRWALSQISGLPLESRQRAIKRPRIRRKGKRSTC